MSGSESRRGFLQALTTLPLIGGGIVLKGAPTGVAVEPSRAMLVAYGTWLEGESRILRWELARMLGMAPESMSHISLTPGDYHFPPRVSWLDVPRPSTRAALVLATVGAEPVPKGGDAWVHREVWRSRDA